VETFDLDKPTLIEKLIMSAFVLCVVGLIFFFGYWAGVAFG
jgi:hypothetical protein